MLLSEEGESIGSVSGGCLDAELRRRIPEVLAAERPILVEYDTGSRDDIVFGLGLGCGGKVALLLSPIARSDPDPLEEGAAASSVSALATVLRSRSASAVPGAQVHLSADGRLVANAQCRPAFVSAIRSVLSTAIEDRAPGEFQLDLSSGEVDVFIERLEPPPTLLLGGAGQELTSLGDFAGSLEWRVEFVLPRVSKAAERRLARFTARRLWAPTDISSLASARAAAVIATHNYLDDLEILRALLPTEIPYIGLLGSRDRVARLVDDADDITASTASARIYGPAGLDIGAETPEEIALSIVSEIQAVFHGRAGGLLRSGAGAIHARPCPSLEILEKS
jgi:xanthine/CO dehydrogenase XdhC/CoxF family maturation factor